MQLQEFIKYIEKSLKRDRLKLSDFGKKEIEKRWNKKESQGGYSKYWKEL